MMPSETAECKMLFVGVRDFGVSMVEAPTPTKNLFAARSTVRYFL